MQTFFVLLMFFTAGNCAAGSDAHNKDMPFVNVFLTSLRINYIEPDFERYVQDFEKLYKVQADAPMYFESELDNDHIGQCWTFDDGYQEIVIEKEWWSRASILRRRALIFHELGHYYGQDHRNEKRKDGCPKSLMHDTIVSQKCLRKYWPSYERELIGGKTADSVKRSRDKRSKRQKVQSRFYRTKKGSKPVRSCCR